MRPKGARPLFRVQQVKFDFMLDHCFETNMLSMSQGWILSIFILMWLGQRKKRKSAKKPPKTLKPLLARHRHIVEPFSHVPRCYVPYLTPKCNLQHIRDMCMRPHWLLGAHPISYNMTDRKSIFGLDWEQDSVLYLS